jgi:micrococcal nuclease
MPKLREVGMSVGCDAFFCRRLERKPRYRYLRTFAVFFAAVYLLFEAPGCRGNPYFSEDTEMGIVKTVIDGDTIEFANGKKVRYIGIDTPEIRRREGKDWVFRPDIYGIEAKERNAALVGGKPLRLKFDIEKQDKYGRYLAYVYANGVMVNYTLVREGFATVHTFPPNIRFYKKLVEYQREAFNARRGLWGTLKEIKASEAGRYGGAFCIVSGKVLAKGFSRGRVWLDLVSDVPGHLNLLIYSRNLALFKAEGIDPLEYYEGKQVEVFGKIHGNDNRPEMVIDNPFQIKVLE